MNLEKVERLLNPDPMLLEMGVERLSSGVLHVAARTDMHGCKGRMLDWWFGWLETTQHYVWWHPGDHISSAWEGWSPGRYVGAVHVVDERLGGDEVLSLQIQFRPPAEHFSQASLDAAFRSGAATALVCGRVGIGDQVPRDGEGRVLGSRLFHVARDTPFGCVLRSHFFLGVDLPGGPEERRDAVPDEVGLGLMKHAYSEFFMLSRFLPSLYAAENREREPVPFPW